MTAEEQLAEKIATYIRRTRLDFSEKRQAKDIMAFVKEAGYTSPEEIARQEQRWVESEKFLNREAAFEEQRLHDEVKYWKGKSDRLN